MKKAVFSTVIGLAISITALYSWGEATAKKALPAQPTAATGSTKASYKENVNYKVVTVGQLVPGNQVEVVEFFSFACPHCAHLEPILQVWKKNLPKGAVLRRVPVVFRPQWESLARAYYTLEALNLQHLEPLVFKAIHEEKQDLSNSELFIKWLAKHNVEEKKIRMTYDSFTVVTKAAQAKAIAQQYRIEGVPTIIVGGKYMTDVSMAGSPEGLPGLLNYLISLSQKKPS